MKIKPEHYSVLKKAMQEKAFLLPAIKSHISLETRQPKDINMRIRWDLFWCTGLKIGESDLPLYDYMNDTHIDTALKKIMTELE